MRKGVGLRAWLLWLWLARVRGKVHILGLLARGRRVLEYTQLLTLKRPFVAPVGSRERDLFEGVRGPGVVHGGVPGEGGGDWHVLEVEGLSLVRGRLVMPRGLDKGAVRRQCWVQAAGVHHEAL